MFGYTDEREILGRQLVCPLRAGRAQWLEAQVMPALSYEGGWSARHGLGPRRPIG